MSYYDYVININPHIDILQSILTNNGWHVAHEGNARGYTELSMRKGHIKIIMASWGRKTEIKIRSLTNRGGYGRVIIRNNVRNRDINGIMQYAEKLIANGPPAITERNKKVIKKPLPKPNKFTNECETIKNNTITTNITCISFKYIGIMTIDKEKGELKKALNPKDGPWFVIYGRLPKGSYGYGVARQFITDGETWYGVKNVYYPSKKKSISRICEVDWKLTKSDLKIITKLLGSIS